MKPPLPRPPRPGQREPEMAAPAWLTGIFAALVLPVAGHVLMGRAMAGMLVAILRILPAAAWEAIFVLAAAWFCAQLLRARRGAPASPWRCPHPTPHLVECAAMLYMFLALPTSLRT